MATQQLPVISELGFVHWHDVWQRASVADLFQPLRRCGIYVLSFSDGEAYVGKSVDVTRRYVKHRQTYDDIETMTFKEVGRDNLLREEASVNTTLALAGVKLRNVPRRSPACVHSDFDLVMSAENQARWLADLDYVDLGGARVHDPDMRRVYAPKYQQFLQQPGAEEAIMVLRTYVNLGIPARARGEMCFWVCSCLPGYSDATVIPYSRISVNWQEVFTVYADEGQICFTWHLAKSPLEPRSGTLLSRMRLLFPSVEVVDHTYPSGGLDQIELRTRGAASALRLMRDPDVRRAIRGFNLRLMKKGRSVFSPYHCFDLADRFYD